MKNGLTDLQLVNCIHSIAKSMASIFNEKPADKKRIHEMVQKFDGNFFFTFEEDTVLFKKTKFEYYTVQFEANAIDGRWYVTIITK